MLRVAEPYFKENWVQQPYWGVISFSFHDKRVAEPILFYFLGEKKGFRNLIFKAVFAESLR